MPRYATGKYALGISDRSGRAYKLNDMLLEWTGFLVGKDEFEAKQPQLDPRHHITDPQALRISRPAREEPAVSVLLEMNPFISSDSGSAVITVIEPGHGRSTGDTVRFRDALSFDGFTESTLEKSDGYSITKVDSDRYSFTAESGTATTGNIRGGGGFASAGPVTLSS
jgi:hypothetical protein|tara:strand:+ start:3446 stop:3949 length:504 start_codon:yes stop_codon:yes gene_type:complete